MPFAGSLGSGTLDEAQPAQVTVIMVWSKPGAARNPEGNMEREIQEFLSDCFIFDQNSVLFPQMENSSEFQIHLGCSFAPALGTADAYSSFPHSSAFFSPHIKHGLPWGAFSFSSC